MSRQIPIHVEPGFKATFSSSRRISDPMADDIRSHRFNRDRIDKDFEDSSKRFFGNNFGRHPEVPDHTSLRREFRSHSPPIFEDRPFGCWNPKTFSCSSPSWRRNLFDEKIQRMMREDSDSFDFSDPESEGDNPSPTDIRKQTKVAKSPSDAVSEKMKHSYKIDRQTSSPGLSIDVDDEGFVDIPVIVCKDVKTKEVCGEIEREKPVNGEEKEEPLNEVLQSECLEREKDELEKGNNKFDSEFTAKILSDTPEEKNDKDDEEKAKDHEKIEEIDLGTPKLESEKSAEENNADDIQEPQKSQKSVQLSTIKTIEDELEKTMEKVKVFEPTGSTHNNKEYLWLEECLMRTLMALDAIEANGCKKIREARKAVVKRVQIGLNELEKHSIPSKKHE